MNDFLNLQVGDCIRLDSRVDTDMNVYVGNIKKFTHCPVRIEIRMLFRSHR